MNAEDEEEEERDAEVEEERENLRSCLRPAALPHDAKPPPPPSAMSAPRVC